MYKLKIIFTLIIYVSVAAGTYGRGLKTPSSLVPGDTIAIISMASTPDSAFIDSALVAIRSWGYVPVVGRYVLAKSGSFAGTVDERLSDLKWAFETPGYKAVMSSRGGYGSMHELALIPRNYFRKHPKWLIGYSDITAVHLAMATDGVKSIHGHMAGYLTKYAGRDSLSQYLCEILQNGKLEYQLTNSSPYNHLGKASGILIGGNLSVLNDLAQTPIDYLAKNQKKIILFIEDVDENIHSVSRIMHRLKFAGILNNVKGIIVGAFTEYSPNSDYDSMNAMIYDIVKDLNIPIVFDFPTGHINDNMPLIQGSNATLQVMPGKVTLTME